MKNNEDFNSFDRTVEVIKEANALYLSHFDKESGMVSGEPFNTETGTSWAMSMISSIEEALKCKYPIVCAEDDKELIDYLNEHYKE